ncbi:hypothetical protein HELRODRAFT_174161 [Helobdella robusta]|uniref:Fibronectin type-III domain-containing protein n=1 Tax=Helobdella robusta TaxID=6412 RepID=T1F7P8_HELRO|nr:hypothetical protein HELRODRAFT_174161 [Helobdella robusta]ESO02756.1 hypothetical protein HELRODRAFT_174161 [Helobdella robusta]
MVKKHLSKCQHTIFNILKMSENPPIFNPRHQSRHTERANGRIDLEAPCAPWSAQIQEFRLTFFLFFEGLSVTAEPLVPTPLNIDYVGIRHDTVVDPLQQILVEKHEQRYQMEGLIPKITYNVSITAYFVDKTWGRPFHYQFLTTRMHRIQVFQIRPGPDLAGFKIQKPAGAGAGAGAGF